MPPGRCVDNAPEALPAAAHSSNGSPRRYALKKPALKLSPAPTVSTGSTGTVVALYRFPPAWTIEPRLPHFTATTGTFRASTSSALSTSSVPVIRLASSSFGSSTSTNPSSSPSGSPHRSSGSSFVSSERVRPRSFNSRKRRGRSACNPFIRNREER